AAGTPRRGGRDPSGRIGVASNILAPGIPRMPETLLFHHDTMIDHDPGRGHPERPERLRAIVADLQQHAVAGAQWVTPTPIAAEEILRVHTPEHLRRVEAARGRH